MFEKLFGRFFKKKGSEAEKKKVPAPAKKEAVEESVGTEKSAQNEEAPENALSSPSLLATPAIRRQTPVRPYQYECWLG